MATAESRSEDTRWDLSDLCANADEARAGWTALVARAKDFAARYRGTIASLDAAGMRAMLDEADEIGQELSRLQVYTFLRLSMDATDVEANDLTTIGRDRGADIENETLFFGLEWIALDDDAAEALLASAELTPYSHKLRVERDEKPYVLSELEEQALNARRPVVSSWQSLHDRQVSTLEVPFDSGDGERPHTVSELLSCLYRTDRGLRLKAVTALFAGLEPRTDVLAACYDALVGDRLTVDRLRGFENPMRPTNMGNELDDEIVEAMLSATEESYGIGRKWFEAKARMLGLDKLELADQYAPIGEARAFSWPEAVEVVDTAFGRFSPRLAEIFRSCLDAGHVDTYPRAGKGPGAYCTAVSKEILPFVLLNYTNRLRDVSTLAHEFGHATHNVLSLEQQTWRSHRCGIPLAEVPSTFAQSLADDYLLANESDAGTRASLAADRMENAMAAIYRQVVLARFEQRAYAMRGDGLALGAERLSELWLEENEKYYGKALALPEGYAFGWSYIPHFIHVRFYTYAYSFAQLVALLLYRRYREDPQAFVPKYLELLGAGGSASPADLVAPFGLDLRSTDTWREAFAELDAMRVEAETLSST
jgi:oligoendopeptidase F